MTSIVAACANTINDILGKRKIDDISIDNTKINNPQFPFGHGYIVGATIMGINYKDYIENYIQIFDYFSKINLKKRINLKKILIK